jgi:hypothetical protein
MKKGLLIVFLIVGSSPVFSQKIDSIYFHLYTDSLKKGQHNYINIDGKLPNGRWVPLTAKDLQFSCAQASFDGNQLIIPENFREEKVTVKVVLKSDPSVSREKTIWIKKIPDPEFLPTAEEIMNGKKKEKNKSKN